MRACVRAQGGQLGCDRAVSLGFGFFGGTIAELIDIQCWASLGHALHTDVVAVAGWGSSVDLSQYQPPRARCVVQIAWICRG